MSAVHASSAYTAALAPLVDQRRLRLHIKDKCILINWVDYSQQQILSCRAVEGRITVLSVHLPC